VPADIPDTFPAASNDIAVPVLLQLPPDTASDKDMDKPAQTLEAPPMAVGVVFTINDSVEVQPASVYEIKEVPGLAPVTVPVVVMVATAVLLLSHVPPLIEGSKPEEEPIQTTVEPLIVATGLTVIVEIT